MTLPSTTCPPALLLGALAFAAHKHRDQRRKDAGATPYINHPIAVARLLVECGIEDPVALQAAVLHDTIEDTETTREELEALFGAEVAAVVVEVTDDKALDKAARKQAQVEHAPRKSARAAMVKAADKACNLRDLRESPPADWDPRRKADYAAWASRVVGALPPVPEALLRRFHAEARALRGDAA